jgi:Arc/MetJ-type ribon-helix-helix transcriptional regulator
MVRTQISMTEEQAEQLRRLAASRKQSQAEIVREALDLLIADDERLRRVTRAKSVGGRYSSGHRTTSVEHDAALDEAYSH